MKWRYGRTKDRYKRRTVKEDYRSFMRKRKYKRRRKSSGMKVAHKQMLKGAGVFLALLVFKPEIPIGLATKVQSMLGGAK